MKRAMLEGTTISACMAAGLFSTLLFVEPSTKFASRWDGGCGGWTQWSIWLHLLGDLAHFWAYITITFVLLRLHPIMVSVPSSRATVYFMGAFISGCGVAHLLDAYAAVNPVYWWTGGFKAFNAVVSVVSAFMIAHNLTVAFAEVRRRKLRYDEVERKLQLMETGK